ncbi:c-type cytochrome [Sulfurovum sp. ST-21]|uniref:C-type cytochrome n=1 Tax=Sulfurovum indicum TaxID=2779528 RepID=A0A7M1S5R1_9BACT|nr:c-type cytochrome [Sulfurovum indicum]QOR62763.1 c-type cytochrome [Sulfurovum indicum]
MKKIAIAMLFAGSTLLMADGAALYAKCAGCHGQNGEKSALGKSAIIKGQDVAKTVEQLHGYKAGTLNQHGMGALMKGQVASMSDDDIKAVAEHIAGLK